MMSKLFRNVPFLTSLEMSPFFVLYLFVLFFSVSLENFSLASPRNDDPVLGRHTHPCVF